MRATGVRETITLPARKNLGKMSVQSSKAGDGEQFPLLDCMAKARVKGLAFSLTLIAHQTSAKT